LIKAGAASREWAEMAEQILSGQSSGDSSEWGGSFAIVYVSEDGNEKIQVKVQVFSNAEPREEQCVLEFGINENLRAMTPFMTVQNGTLYGLCVAAQVSAQVWNDYLDCKKVAKANSPTGTWAEIQKNSLACLAKKHPGITRAFNLALIKCTPTLLASP
jgi:hypothetical protein